MIEHDTGLNKEAKNAFQQTLMECERFVPKTISTGHFLLGLIASATTLPSAIEDTLTSVFLLNVLVPGLAPLAQSR